jgi:glycosyltransferase involved in cell wall biosynthesis
MPADLATVQADLNSISKIGILAWFEVEPFRNDDMVRRHCLEVPRGMFHIMPHQYRKAKQILSNYDIIHTHHPHSGFYGKLIATRLGKPIVNTDHNNHDGYTRKGRIANGITNVLADQIVPVSESVKNSFASWEDTLIHDEKIQVINNGVDINRLKSAQLIDWSIQDHIDIEPDAVIVGSAGELTEQKAHEILIDAVDRANDEAERPVELVISGEGELRGNLEVQIETANHSDRLHLLGFLEKREQVYKMMHEVDIFAMPSRWEGFCVAALEAMAIGNACVFSNIPEFWEPFSSCAQFHAVNDASRLADRIETLSTDAAKRESLAKTAQKLVFEQYTIERTANQYIQSYLDIEDVTDRPE